MLQYIEPLSTVPRLDDTLVTKLIRGRVIFNTLASVTQSITCNLETAVATESNQETVTGWFYPEVIQSRSDLRTAD